MNDPPTSTIVLDGSTLSPDLLERRRHERYPVTGRVFIFHSAADEPAIGWLTDISCGGAFIKTHELFPEGTRLRLVFGIDGGYDLGASVVRTSDQPHETPAGPGIAVRFDRELPSK